MGRTGGPEAATMFQAPLAFATAGVDDERQGRPPIVSIEVSFAERGPAVEFESGRGLTVRRDVPLGRADSGHPETVLAIATSGDSHEFVGSPDTALARLPDRGSGPHVVRCHLCRCIQVRASRTGTGEGRGGSAPSGRQGTLSLKPLTPSPRSGQPWSAGALPVQMKGISHETDRQR